MKKNTRRQALKWLGSAIAGVIAAGPLGLLPFNKDQGLPDTTSQSTAAGAVPSRTVKPAQNSVKRHG